MSNDNTVNGRCWAEVAEAEPSLTSDGHLASESTYPSIRLTRTEKPTSFQRTLYEQRMRLSAAGLLIVPRRLDGLSLARSVS